MAARPTGQKPEDDMKTIRMLFRLAVYLLSTPADRSFGPYLQEL